MKERYGGEGSTEIRSSIVIFVHFDFNYQPIGLYADNDQAAWKE